MTEGRRERDKGHFLLGRDQGRSFSIEGMMSTQVRVKETGSLEGKASEGGS